MSTEKRPRPSTADEIAKLIIEAKEERGYADKFTDRVNAADSDESGELLDLAMGGLVALEANLRLANALESQADQLKQAREQLAAAEYVIAAADSHIAHDFERRTHLEEVLMAYRECYPLAANPAPTTEDDHGNN